MTTFAYTTGNPANLTGGVSASMNDIQGPFTDLRTFLNGGNLDTGNLATSAKPATLLGQFAPTPLTGVGIMASGGLAGTYWLGSGGGMIVSGGAGSTPIPFVALGSGGYTVSGLTAMARLVCSVMVNNVAPACNFTLALHGLASTGGGSGISFSTSGALAGSSVAFTTPAANATTQSVSADFALPTSGLYALAVVTSATLAVNTAVQMNAALQVHWV